MKNPIHQKRKCSVCGATLCTHNKGNECWCHGKEICARPVPITVCSSINTRHMNFTIIQEYGTYCD